MDNKVTVETKGHIMLIGLNRPVKYNAMDLDMYFELARSLMAN